MKTRRKNLAEISICYHEPKVYFNKTFCRKCYERNRYLKRREKQIEYSKKYKKDNPEKVKQKLKEYYLNNKDKFWDYNIKRNYNISKEEFYKFLKKQNYKCAICNKEQGDTKLVVDHDHKSKEIRGLLCKQCNLVLGHLESLGGWSWALQAISYLNNF